MPGFLVAMPGATSSILATTNTRVSRLVLFHFLTDDDFQSASEQRSEPTGASQFPHIGPQDLFMVFGSFFWGSSNELARKLEEFQPEFTCPKPA